MKFSKSFSEAICIIVLLAVQKNHKPIPSYLISNKLEISDSYLRKTIKKLVNANIISSTTGKNGGIFLKKAPEEINFFDIYSALEEPSLLNDFSIADKLFIVKKEIEKKENKFIDIINSFEQQLFSSMKEKTISDLFTDENIKEGYLDWYAYVKGDKIYDANDENFFTQNKE